MAGGIRASPNTAVLEDIAGYVRSAIVSPLRLRAVRQMRRREILGVLGGAAVWPLVARAQQAGKVHRIGFLGSATAAGSAKAVRVTPNGATRIRLR